MNKFTDPDLLDFMNSDSPASRDILIASASPNVSIRERLENEDPVDFPNREAYRRHKIEFPSDYLKVQKKNAEIIKEYLDAQKIWYRTYDTLNMFFASVNSAQVKQLNEMDAVGSMQLNRSISIDQEML